MYYLFKILKLIKYFKSLPDLLIHSTYKNKLCFFKIVSYLPVKKILHLSRLLILRIYVQSLLQWLLVLTRNNETPVVVSQNYHLS